MDNATGADRSKSSDVQKVFLGSVRIKSVNQIGECVKLDSRASKFTLAKRGSIFDLYTLQKPWDDFRQMENLEVLLKCGPVYLAFDPVTFYAVPISDDDVSSKVILHYFKRKFDSISVSFNVKSGGKSLWLRHCNSMLRVCC